MTRIPLKAELDVDESDFTRAALFFPAIGFILGSILFLAAVLMDRADVSPLLAGTTITLLLVYLTGGLHIDGLSDTFDGIYSGRSKERILEIMKDSRIGSFGMTAVLGVVLLKTAAIAELYDGGDFVALIVAPVFARCMIVYASYKEKYARENGMGNYFIGKISNLTLIISFATCALVSIYSLRYLALIVVMMAFTSIFKSGVKKKIDGLTGDNLGAIAELNEALFLLSAVVLSGL